MKTLCFYISDYGLGHAARAIGLIRELVLAQDELRVIVKTSGPLDLVRRSLVHPRVSVVDCRNESDVVLMEGQSTVDRARTRAAFLAWMFAWDEYVAREVAFCRAERVDLILSDITPQAFEVAEASGTPSIAVSNFTWETIYGHLFPDLGEVGRLRAAYNMASYACILPFEIGMERFSRNERVGLVSRRITVLRGEMRRRLGIPEDDFLVFVGKSPKPPSLNHSGFVEAPCAPGASTAPDMAGARVRPFTGDTVPPAKCKPITRYLVSTGTPIPGAIPIPATETESQHWIGMCDCVVAKCGYSTVSEAMRARLPLLVWKRDGFVEDVAIAGTIERLGIGRTVGTPGEGVALCRSSPDEIQEMRDNYENLEDPYTSDGIPAVLRVVEELMR
ncbi:hypothetical protein DSECCO2_423560 [anaerobic digester metagenome]